MKFFISCFSFDGQLYNLTGHLILVAFQVTSVRSLEATPVHNFTLFFPILPRSCRFGWIFENNVEYEL